MFLLLPFITLIASFKSIISLKKEYISKCNHNSKIIQNYTLSTTYGANDNDCDCFNGDFENLNLTETITCFLKCWKKNPSKFKEFVELVKVGIILIDVGEVNISQFGNMGKIVLNITRKVVNNNTMVDRITNILSTTNITDLLIDIINMPEYLKTNETIQNFLFNLTNIKGFHELFMDIFKSSRTDFLDLIEEFMKGRQGGKMLRVFKLIRTKLGDIIDDVIDFIYKLFRDSDDKNKIFDNIAEFIINHNSSYDKIKEVIMDDVTANLLEELIEFQDPVFRRIFRLVFYAKTNLAIFLEAFRDRRSVEIMNNVFKHMTNLTHVKLIIKDLAENIVRVNNSMLEPFTAFIVDFICNQTQLTENEDLTFLTVTSFQKFLRGIFEDLNYSSYNFTNDCLELLYYTYFNHSMSDKSLFFVYLQKYLFDSSRNKGNFLPFDNCMYNSYNHLSAQKFNITPAFIIGIINEEEEKKNNKNSSFYFKYNFLKGYCLPFGYKNESAKDKNQPMCSKEDYRKAFSVLNSFYSTKKNINITALIIDKNNISPNGLDIFLGVLGILILAFPILIYIFLLISGNVIANKQKKINEVNEIEKNPKMKNNELIEVNSKKIKKKIIYPRWYQYLNECFDLKENLKELFNFSSINTNYNNFKGMTYIKGTIGIFIILTVFGQTFIALINLPTKNYGIWDYFLMMRNFFYLILYIGYRYSPRILFSCSGYSLIYKYLCYLEQEQRLYFLKFVFLQFYKYIYLTLSIIFIRYLLYNVVFLITNSKRPLWEVFKHFITNEGNFIRRFFTFLVYFEEKENLLRQNLIFYFYIPINEVLFFIIGTGLISLGYKFKLRIDIIIFILILLVYALKIILFNVKPEKEEKTYISTDYYLFDYGLSIDHPLFNLNYFLIGMFFGLINYSIQKGITDLEEKNNYQNVFLLSDSNIIDEEEEYQETNYRGTFAIEKMNIEKNELNIRNESNVFKGISRISNNNKILPRSITISKDRNENQRIKDIKYESNANLEKLILEENRRSSRKIEYSDKIKEIPFLIWPIKFSNFHKKNKDKSILIFVIVIAFFLFILFINTQFFFTIGNLNGDIDEKKIVDELSFRKVIPKPALNIIFLLDIEIAIFLIQWINFILYFKEVGIIKNFLNHAYWSFFVKSYFSFNIISVTVILSVFYINENSIKFNFSNILLYTCIDIILILIFTIAVYCLFELPLKKAFKFFLKGEEALNNEENDDEYEQEEVQNESEEDKSLKDDYDSKK